MFSLDNREKSLLLGVARQAMTAAVLHLPLRLDLPDALGVRECEGAFVTLRRLGRLRGCIGQIAVKGAVAEIVAYAARAAALEDPRFPQVTAEELDEIEIELSLLSEHRTVTPDQIEAGKHGLIVSRGVQRGLLLPQVATEHGWSGLRLLEETCLKAGMERDAWKDTQTQIAAFTALVFSESEVRQAATI